MTRRRPPDEFEIIARYFAPLAGSHPGAHGLTDDAATLSPTPGRDIVITADAVVAGVHFLADDPPDLIGRKALRVNLSDLAAKGATPLGYLMTIALPLPIDEGWLGAFARGLAADQAEFDIVLLGGDTTATPGPLSISITALGDVLAGQTIHRDTAQAGDAIFVSGTLGDSALGLEVGRGGVQDLDAEMRSFLLDRYRLPRPRTKLGPRLVGVAHAALDVSDGLIGDLMHICECSQLGAIVEAGAVPLSSAAQRALAKESRRRNTVLSGGDDYEILFTAPLHRAMDIGQLAVELDLPLTRIGTMVEGTGVAVRDETGVPIAEIPGSYRHFAHSS